MRKRYRSAFEGQGRPRPDRFSNELDWIVIIVLIGVGIYFFFLIRG